MNDDFVRKTDLDRVDAKVDRNVESLNSKIDRDVGHLDSKVDRNAKSLDSKVDREVEHLKFKVEHLDSKTERLIKHKFEMAKLDTQSQITWLVARLILWALIIFAVGLWIYILAFKN